MREIAVHVCTLHPGSQALVDAISANFCVVKTTSENLHDIFSTFIQIFVALMFFF